MKMTSEDEGLIFDLEIARVEITKLLSLVEEATFNPADLDMRARLCAEYTRWDRESLRALLVVRAKHTDLAFSVEWMALPFFQPVAKEYEFPSLSGVVNPALRKKASAKAREIISDLNELRGAVRMRAPVLEKAIAALNPKGDEGSGRRVARLESLHLITQSLVPSGAIFLVLDRHFDSPIRCHIRNAAGEPTYISKLYDVAYPANAPGKRVSYDKRLADNINNGLFKMAHVADYMSTNDFKKPTLVRKSDEGTLVLKNEIVVKTELVNNIPAQFRSLYIDKTQ